MTWHPDHDQLAAYQTSALALEDIRDLEHHVERCDRCRTEVSALVPRDRLDRLWLEVADLVDAPRPRLLERVLARVGVPEDRARLLAMTPSAHGAWLMAVSFTTLFAITAAGRTSMRQTAFLVLAPLVPLLGVHLAYGTAVDPTHELTAATPRTGLTLMLQRSLLVVGGTAIVVAAMGLILPIPLWSAAAWLLPSLALTGLALALTAIVPAAWAFGGVAATWTAILLALPTGGTQRMTVFSAPAQLAWAVVLVTILLVLGSGGIPSRVGNRWQAR